MADRTPEEIVRDAALAKTCHEADPKLSCRDDGPLVGCGVCKHCGCLYVKSGPRRECAVRSAKRKAGQHG